MANNSDTTMSNSLLSQEWPISDLVDEVRNLTGYFSLSPGTFMVLSYRKYATGVNLGDVTAKSFH
jgi:hypothetical protein